ncbi:MAG: RsmE family RNA methyltransferase [Candidatus Caccosoma sp.]|nr:RsmE family RNA methyltransferase [Candidatus Caccosoma sp.]
MQRYFVSKKNDKFILTDLDLHHIKDVMRIKSNGEIICVYDNKSYLCTITYNNSAYDIKIINERDNDVELSKDVILYQAVIKNEKFDLVVQKSCELGVKEIVPTIFERSVVKIDNKNIENKLNRYNKIIKEACEQSHRQVLANIKPFINVKDIKEDDDTLKIMAYENNNDKHSLKNVLNKIDNYKKIAIVIGPEGGFTIDEVNYLLSVGFISVSLGKRILRSETASIALLAIIASYLEG